MTNIGARVVFRHYQYEIEEDILRRYGSSHREGRGRRELADLAAAAMRLERVKRHEFHMEQLRCANEAFPEAAVADPFADLETLDEWRTGYRAFPYPGIYSRIGLLGQSSKGAATSSVGVVGEILTGLYAQAGIAPWVHARVTGDWPDFILISPNQDRRFHLVESKARSALDEDGEEPVGLESDSHWLGFPKTILGEGVQKAVRDLLADPRVSVWYSFVAIKKLSPLEADVTFLEMTADPNVARPKEASLVPGGVLDAFARRGVAEATSDLPAARLAVLAKKGALSERKLAQAELAMKATNKAVELIKRMGLELASHEKDLKECVQEVVEAIPLGEFRPGKTFEASRRMAAKGQFARVRGGPLVIRDLLPSERARLEESWKPYDWDAAPTPFSVGHDESAWRCSEALLGCAALGAAMEEGADAASGGRTATPENVTRAVGEKPRSNAVIPGFLVPLLENGARVWLRNRSTRRTVCAEQLKLRPQSDGPDILWGRVVRDDGTIERKPSALGAAGKTVLTEAPVRQT